MSSDLPTSLASIETALRRLDRGVLLAHLRPGVSADEVRGTLGAVGLPSPPELVELYAWRDGTAESEAVLGEIWFVPGFYLLSLEAALEHYRIQSALGGWDVGWWPVLANSGGDYHVLDLGSGPVPPVRRFGVHEGERPIMYRSLGALLATVAEAFDRGVIYVDGNGYLEMDDHVFMDLAAELNPDVSWWRER